MLRDIDQYAFDPDLKPDVETLMDMQRLFQQAGIIVYNPPLPPNAWPTRATAVGGRRPGTVPAAASYS